METFQTVAQIQHVTAVIGALDYSGVEVMVFFVSHHPTLPWPPLSLIRRRIRAMLKEKKKKLNLRGSSHKLTRIKSKTYENKIANQRE